VKRAVLLLAHGTPESAEQVPAYLQYVTSGRPIPPEVVAEIQHRYAQIGRSPLTDITREQAEALARVLDMPVYFGMRNWHPFIAAAVEQMLANAITDAIVICLAPQNSRTSVGLYRKAVLGAAGEKLQLDFVEEWHAHPQLISAFAEKLRAARRHDERVIFTAHSVPCRTIVSGEQAGDPYGRQARETAALVAKQADLAEADWVFAFQSQGVSGGPWIGPTVEETIEGLAREGVREILVQPIGFVCDHVEVLYDIDIAFKQFADAHGVTLTRTESLNTSPRLIAALADIVRSRAREHATA
jgi:protoporphyrin/coproporphyrin ferrochelatase